MKPRRQFLRENTANAHAALDREVGALANLDAYRKYLSSMYRFRASIERSLERARLPAGLDGWRIPAIAHELEADLSDLAIEVPDHKDPEMPIAGDAAFGVGYVLTGSALGARLLLGRAEALGLNAHHGARHLASQSAGSHDWRDFLESLEAADPLDLDAVLGASNATFAAAHAAFASNL